MEVAIRALRLTKRNLDVDTKTHRTNKNFSTTLFGKDAGELLALRRIRNHFNKYGPLPRAVKFTKKHSLPGAKYKPCIFDQHDLAGAGQNGLHVRISVALRVPIGTGMGNHSVENAFQVARYIGVGMLVDGNARGGVGNVDPANSPLRARFPDRLFDVTCNIDKLRAAT